MPKKKTNACAAFMLALMMSAAGCASKSELPVLMQQCQPPPAPSAWAMEKGSNSVSELDSLFGIFAEE